MLLTGCSRSYDAWFANPCPAELRVRTFYANRVTSDLQAGGLIAEARLAAESVTRVKDAFQDAAGFTWFIQVGDSAPTMVTRAEMPKWFVSIPASACSPS